ncbi:Peptidyl-tRNA hydrolase [Corynebacterium auriscanis]|nr:Peptidyl-tRNA hydrolase [Corynebacterium auriscanis]
MPAAIMYEMSIKGLFSKLFGGQRGASTQEVRKPPPEWIVIGLGNPGAKYATTRHNVGYMASDFLFEQLNTSASPLDYLKPVKGQPFTEARVQLGAHPLVIIRSTTYMNESGEAVKAASEYYGVAPEKIIVLHDELDIAHGRVRVKLGGNENGHNGLKSTTAELGTRDYVRVRMGIGRPAKGQTVIDHVLSPIASGPETDALITETVRAVELLVTVGLQKAQHEIHTKK